MAHETACTIEIRNAVPRLPEIQFRTPVNWRVRPGEHWAVIGPNGAGKTLLADLLCSRYALREGEIVSSIDEKRSERIRSIAFRDIYSMVDARTSYYQQRWHTTETEETATAEAILQKEASRERIESLFERFGASDLLKKRILFFSSGELRKFLIVKALLSAPRVLILDNPFIGLDAASRAVLTELLGQLSRQEGLQVILLLSEPGHVPELITHILPVRERTLGEPVVRDPDGAWKTAIETLFSGETALPALPVGNAAPSEHAETVRLEGIHIRYGDRTILQNLDWTVRNGEKWALLGPNGSGKSTLLSLICADNPQSYANTIYLFDRKRGSGESVWEIKKRIGYVSPEMHLYYLENVPTLQIVASGHFDTVGLYRKCTPEQEATARQWTRLFGIRHLEERRFLTLSSGEQRLALLARAFVKNPDLLILDEPLHGLDIANKRRASRIVEAFCALPGKTLIYVTHYPREIPACVDRRFELTKQA